MLIFLRLLFAVVLVSMLSVTTWAGLHCPLFAVPHAVATHPWLIATLFDAYWGFLTFYVWVWSKQTSPLARLSWFAAIMLLGNIAMSAYCLRELFAVPRTSRLQDVLTLRHEGVDWFGPTLAVAGGAILFLA